MRRHNLASLLQLLHVNGATSRAALTASTGLNRSTVKALVAELANLGLVRESAPAGTGMAGRPSILVEPESAQVFAVAVDIGVEHLTVARIGLAGTVIDRRHLDQRRGDHDVELTVRRAAKLITQQLDRAPLDAVCVGVGVAVPGLVAADGGVVRFAPNLGWKDLPFKRLLAERVGRSLPIAVGNEADLGAMAEHIRGAAARYTDAVYLSGEFGLGGGIIVGGRLLVGAGGYAGEIGHMIVNPRGQRCRCGARGCWETEVGEEAILRATKSRPGTTLDEVREAFEHGDPAAHKGIRQIGKWLGVGIANLANIFNPQIVILGGTTREIYAAALPFVRETLQSVLAAPRDHLRLQLAALGSDSALLGAAEKAFAALLQSPDEVAGELAGGTAAIAAT